MSNTISALDPAFTNLINQLMVIERQPLNRLTEQRDSMNVKQAVYSDLRTRLDELQQAARALTSTRPEYSFSAGRAVQVSGADGFNVLTAAASTSAVPARYTISVQSLARQHQVRSDRQTLASTQALGLSGRFQISSNIARTVETVTGLTGTLTGCDVLPPVAGQDELGSGDYWIETRQDEGGQWQFRLVDASGPLSIQAGGSGSFTAEWQVIPAGQTMDTGRGLSLTFASDPTQFTAGSRADGSAAQVRYAAQSAVISVEAGDTLVDLAYRINQLKLAGGASVTAAIIDNQLILSLSPSGSGNELQAQDLEGGVLAGLGLLQDGAWKNVMQTPADALFSVNGLPVQRSSNSGLTDVIHGVTLNLAADAEGKTVYLDVLHEPTSEKDAVQNFITKFNALMTFLGDKIATIKQADDTYKRGALAGDPMFANLRSDLIRLVQGDHGGSSLSNMRLAGLSMDDKFQLKIDKLATFEKAVREQKTDLVDLLDGVMSGIEGALNRFTGADGYVQFSVNSLDQQIKETRSRIDLFNQRLTAKEESLRQQFAEAQATIQSLSYMQQQLAAIYGGINLYQ